MRVEQKHKSARGRSEKIIKRGAGDGLSSASRDAQAGVRYEGEVLLAIHAARDWTRCGSAPAGARAPSGARRGRSNQTVVPRPGSLSMVMRPR